MVSRARVASSTSRFSPYKSPNDSPRERVRRTVRSDELPWAVQNKAIFHGQTLHQSTSIIAAVMISYLMLLNCLSSGRGRASVGT